MAQGQHQHLAFTYRVTCFLGHKQIFALVFLLTAIKPTEILTSIIQFYFCYSDVIFQTWVRTLTHMRRLPHLLKLILIYHIEPTLSKARSLL